MCNFEDGFKLCTCVEEAPNSKLPPETYIWEIRIFDRREFVQGRCMIPSDDLGHGLEHEWVELNLNCEPCFDFDYQPKDGDNLIIYQTNHRYPFLSFMYRNNVWVKDFYDELSEYSKLQRKGKVKSL